MVTNFQTLNIGTLIEIYKEKKMFWIQIYLLTLFWGELFWVSFELGVVNFISSQDLQMVWSRNLALE